MVIARNRTLSAIKAAFNQFIVQGSRAGFGTLSSHRAEMSDTWAATPPGNGGPSFIQASALSGAAMLYLVIKAAISGIIVAAVSEIARRYPGWGGLVASLPLTSLLAMIWLFRDTHDAERVAELSASTIWFILPSIPLFIALPALIRSGVSLWLSMAIVIAGTLALYAMMFWAAPRLGVKL